MKTINQLLWVLDGQASPDGDHSINACCGVPAAGLLMLLIKSILEIPLDVDNTMLINTLSGWIDVVGREEWEIIQNWQGDEHITPLTEKEKTLFDELLRRGYLVSSYAEEQERKNEVMSVLQDLHTRATEEIITLAFIITYGCNFRCPYCYEATAKDSNLALTRDMVDAAYAISDSV